MSNRIFEEMQETAQGMLTAGVISKQKADEIIALCQSSVTPISSDEIKSLRESFNVSQSVFASLLNISKSTVQKWEIGDKKPSGSSLKLLSIVRKHGLSALV